MDPVGGPPPAGFHGFPIEVMIEDLGRLIENLWGVWIFRAAFDDF